ncbi:MAG: nickel-dependent lactate racemase [Promethearchaeota archaeon]
MVKTFKVPWAAWREPKHLELMFPDSWGVELCRMLGADGPELNEKEIQKSIKNPINTPRLSELASEKKEIAIVVDDMTRTTPISKILPYILEELHIGGVEDEQITILLALGAHRPMTRQDCILKLGKEITDKYKIENHHPYENLEFLGESKIGTPIYVNKTYYKSDLKIAIGGVIPHPLAGFGGGAKIILPGICGIETLEANHSAALRGIGVGLGRITQLREDIEDTTQKIGLHFSVNIVLTELGGIAGVFAGHYIDAHRRAMELAKKNYSTIISPNNDICFFNSYPEDSELNQCFKALNFILTAPANLIKRKGTIVIMTSSYEGKGYHSLLWETGSRLYKNFGDSIIWKPATKRRTVFVFSPNISETDLYHFFPRDVKLFREWDGLIEKLNEIYGDSPKAAIFPCSIQLSK